MLGTAERRPIPGFGIYSVDAEGNVYGPRGKRRLHTKKHKPYLTVGLSRDGKTITRLVHQLVLEAFVGSKPEGMEGRHLNGDRFNNRLSNLKWGTPKQNTADSIRLGVHPNLPYITKVPPVMRPALAAMRSAGAEYRQIGARFGISASQAQRLVNGRTSGRHNTSKADA